MLFRLLSRQIYQQQRCIGGLGPGGSEASRACLLARVLPEPCDGLVSGCVHSLSVLAKLGLKQLVQSHRLAVSFGSRVHRVRLTSGQGRDWPVRIAAADACPDGLENAPHPADGQGSADFADAVSSFCKTIIDNP